MFTLRSLPSPAFPPALRTLLTGAAVAGLLLLNACVSPPPSPAPERGGETTSIEPRDEVEIQLAQAARETEPDLRARYLVRAAMLLMEQGEDNEALALLQDLPLAELTPPRRATVLLLQAQLHQSLGDTAEVTLSLLNPANFPVSEVDTSARLQYHRLRVRALSELGRAPEAINELIQLGRLLPPEEQGANHDALWRELKQLSDAQLRSLASTAVDFEARGWYELAAAMRGADLDQQAASLQRWRGAWGRHPAAAQLPTELMLSLEATPPARIALLLPLGTEAGRLIRDAFLGAYYSQEENGAAVPAVRLYDAAANADILALHEQARRDGAELIVGPLLKQQVSDLMTQADLGVPTLALNNVEGMTPASPLLYQFALSPEDEARQLAQRAWRDGYRFAAVVSPADAASNDFYLRKRAAFLAQWEQLGGGIVANSTYSGDYTATLTRLLAFEASNARRRRVQELIGQNVEFTQRRRQDVDFIYLIAQPEPARLIMPSLAYLFAGDIPVYASQDVYAGGSRQVDDVDLNGVLFPESPWLLEGADGGVAQLKRLFPLNDAQSLRLQAFGIDAFRLSSRLQLLAASGDFSFPGASGLLHMDAERNIQRDLSWATITQGLLQSAPPR